MYLYSIDLGEKEVFYPTRRKAEQEARRAHHNEIVRMLGERPTWQGLEIEPPTITRYSVRRGLPRREMFVRMLNGREWWRRMRKLPPVRPTFVRFPRPRYT